MMMMKMDGRMDEWMDGWMALCTEVRSVLINRRHQNKDEPEAQYGPTLDETNKHIRHKAKDSNTTSGRTNGGIPKSLHWFKVLLTNADCAGKQRLHLTRNAPPLQSGRNYQVGAFGYNVQVRTDGRTENATATELHDNHNSIWEGKEDDDN